MMRYPRVKYKDERIKSLFLRSVTINTATAVEQMYGCKI